MLRSHQGGLVTAAPVVAETAWMIESRLGPAAEARFVRLVITGEITIAATSTAGTTVTMICRSSMGTCEGNGA